MNHVIIVAAGQGQRMSMRKDKLLLPVLGKPLVYYTITAFNDHPDIDSIIIVANKNNKKLIEEVVKKFHFQKVDNVILGGLLRQNSVEKGIEVLEKKSKSLAPSDIILIHNGANPLPSHKEIFESIKKSKEVGACIVGHNLDSTIKEIDGRHIVKTHDRKKFFAAQTPQSATYKVLKKALNYVKKQKLQVTDEAMMFEAIGQKIAYVNAHEHNFKITNQTDYGKLRTILGDFPDGFRIGLGMDSHMFEGKTKGLILGGLKLKNELKLKANSDGDVILHAIFNAISQAIGEMSLGFYADSECEKGQKDSKKYLKIILEKMKKQGFVLNSLGLMIEAARPKIDPLVSKIKKELSNFLDLDIKRIGITATTGEQCTVFGEGLGIQCFCIVSLVIARLS